MISPASKAISHDPNFDARSREIGDRSLDGIAATLDELEQSQTRRAAVANALWARCAPLICRQALCRRAQRCRRDPCVVPSPNFATGPR